MPDIDGWAWGKDRKGRLVKVLSIDKAKYCVLATPDGKIVARHEPYHTLTANFATEACGIAEERKTLPSRCEETGSFPKRERRSSSTKNRRSIRRIS